MRVAAGGLFYAVRFVRRLVAGRSETFGSARFATARDLRQAGLYDGDGLILARHNGKIVTAPGASHLFCVAPTGAGKTTGLVIPNVMTLGSRASLFVVDPKAEVLARTREVREYHGPVFVWAPFSDTSNAYNPLEFIRAGTLDERDDADLVTTLLLPYGKTEEPFWVDEARQLVMGLILHVLYAKPKPQRTLAEVRHLLMLGRKDFMTLMRGGMAKSHHPLVRQSAQAVLQKDERQLSGVLATVQSKTRVWDSPRLATITANSDFSFADLKHQVATVYLCIPPERLDTYYPALRVLVGLAIAEASRTQAEGDHRVTFMLDEFANLGRLPPAETAISIARSAGVQLCLFVQDLAQLKRVYGDAWRSFTANCRTKAFFGINDIDEAKRLSATLGNTTVATRQTGSSSAFGRFLFPERTSDSHGQTARRLLTPDELLNLTADHVIVLVQGQRPILGKRFIGATKGPRETLKGAD